MNARVDSLPPWWMSLAHLFNDVYCDSDHHLHVDGRCFSPQHRAIHVSDASYNDDPRVGALQQYLYNHYYAGLDSSCDTEQAVWQPPAQPPLTSGPWRVLEELSGGALIAQRGAIVRRLEPGEYLYDGVPAHASRHSQVIRQRSRNSSQLDPGFHYLFGLSEADACSEECLLRYYLAPYPKHLANVVTLLCQALDHARLPYTLKYPANAQDLVRHDAVVLYVGVRYARQTHALFAQHAETLHLLLRSKAPLWAHVLLPGLSFAQDPSDGSSFGENRCRALAQGLMNAAQDPSSAKLSHIQKTFAQANIDWEQPHLEIDEEDCFGLRQLRFQPVSSQPHCATVVPSNPLLWQEAINIGQYLCSQALWHQNDCTWITDDADDEAGCLTAYARTMNGSLYDGSLGVAAFLILLAECSGEAHFADVALGALRHALQQRTGNLMSLYEGRLGIVTQGLYWAQRSNDSTLIQAYQHAAQSLLASLPLDDNDADLMHGMAGSIIGLLGLTHSAPHLAELSLHRALQLGERLAQLAERSPQGWHWPGDGHSLGLCGLSHGNAGIALAFSALHRASPARQWQEAVEATLAYEAHWFIPQQANWPYLFPEDASTLQDKPQNCGMAWCHGAPGIALSRLALWQLTGEARYRTAAMTALQTLATDLTHPQPQAGSSYTLCHGPAGNADILLSAATALDQPQWVTLARQVAERGLAKHAGNWPSGLGVANGHALGLMLGLAGSGYFLLRCASPTPPTSLLLPPELL